MTTPGRRSSPRWSRGRDLDADQTAWAMGEILAGEATPAQIAGFAVALRAKGETIDELDGPGRRDVRRRRRRSRVDGPAARRRRHRRRPLDVGQHLDDGGDRGGRRRCAAWSSTATGRRPRRRAPPTCSRRSASGSTCRPTRVAEVADEAGITFCFAAGVPPGAAARGRARGASSAIGTTFNFLGPLANPARPAAQAIGCADPRMAPVMAGVFAAARRRRLGRSAATTGSTS